MQTIKDVQISGLSKRVVTLIRSFYHPQDIYNTITTKTYPYGKINFENYKVRDQAMLSLYFGSAGRGVEVVGGPRFKRSRPEERNEENKRVCIVCGNLLYGSQRKFCSRECREDIHTHKPPEYLTDEEGNLLEHPGILIENMNWTDSQIFIKEMTTAKRSPQVIEKYGEGATLRATFAIPLKRGLYENVFYDQLVPFGWLIKEYYLKQIKDKRTEGSFIPIQRSMAYKIVREVTGNYLNWFRAQSKQFYGSYIFERNAVELAEFVNDQDAQSERAYTKYDWSRQLKDKTQIMNFDWIDTEVEKIKERIEND